MALSRARRWLSRLATDEPAPVGASGVSALAEVVRSGPLRLGDLAARERIAAGRRCPGWSPGWSSTATSSARADPRRRPRRAAHRDRRPASELLAESRRRRTAELAARLDRLTDARPGRRSWPPRPAPAPTAGRA